MREGEEEEEDDDYDLFGDEDEEDKAAAQTHKEEIVRRKDVDIYVSCQGRAGWNIKRRRGVFRTSTQRTHK